MASEIRERLYALLPSIHRVRDADRGQVLRALMAVLETEFQSVEDDVQGLYDNWFVETADPWVLPYIADLLGLEGIQSREGYSRRATVANTVAFRRRKGTASMLESLAYAETNWQARAVEFFQRLNTTQHLNHIRADNLVGVDIHDADALELLGGPFETYNHTAELRTIDKRQGRYNIPNVGLMLWRLNAYHVQDATARKVYTSADGKRIGYRFDALDLDAPLFNQPRTETELSHLATELDVPGRLRNRALGDALADPSGYAESYAWWWTLDDEPAFLVRADGDVGDSTDGDVVGLDHLHVFIPWRRDDATEFETVNDWENMVPPEGTVLVDAERGRIVVHLSSDQTEPTELRVDFRYGFSAELGGGPYDRTDSMGDDWDLSLFTVGSGGFQVGVSRKYYQETDPSDLDPGVYETLAAAVAAWNTAAQDLWDSQGQGLNGLIVLMDSRTYEEDLIDAAGIVIPPGSALWIVAAAWDAPTDDEAAETGDPNRQPGEATPDGLRPHLRGTVEVTGLADETGETSPGKLYLNGLRIEGDLKILAGDLGQLSIAHCTQVPGSTAVRIEGGTLADASDANANLHILVERSILGGIEASTAIDAITLDESIIDIYSDETSISASDTDLTATSTTVFGTTSCRTATASDCIFVGTLTAALKQEGCVRFCYVTLDSVAPRRYRCQPESAIEDASDDLADMLEARIRPSFTSHVYGAPGYAQLRRLVRDEIRKGAEDSSEMGAFCLLQQPQRESNLLVALRQYLRFGLSAGLFFVS